jgi:hypothetical protein
VTAAEAARDHRRLPLGTLGQRMGGKIAGAKERSVANHIAMAGGLALEASTASPRPRPILSCNPSRSRLSQWALPLLYRVRGHTQKTPLSLNFDSSGRDIVRRDRTSARGVESGMMPMASQNAILDRAAMQWKIEIPTTAVERKNFVPPYMASRGQTLPSANVMPLLLSPPASRL